jgi:hypothetical protein
LHFNSQGVLLEAPIAIPNSQWVWPLVDEGKEKC